MQSTQEKARYHLERSEHWQTIVDAYENEAMAKAAQQLKGRMSRTDGLETETGYVADSLLRDHHGYKNACGNRNSHQRQAEIYCLAVCAGITETPWDRTEKGLIKVEPNGVIDIR